MGRGSYSHEAHRRVVTQRKHKAPKEVFRQGGTDPRMKPFGVVRESRDSEGNENSIGIIFALDVSASMEAIPHELAKDTLPAFMSAVLDVLPDAQVLFMAFGNGFTDRSALQAGQFETTGELMDQWLSAVHIESGGGGMGESYDLAMLFASRQTSMDCFEKRQRKGYLFITGDEVPFDRLHVSTAKRWTGLDIGADMPIHTVCAEVLERFHTFFLIPDPVRAKQCEACWRTVLGERVIVLPRPAAAAQASALAVSIVEGVITTPEGLSAHVLKYAPEHPELDAALQTILAHVTAGGFPPPRETGTSTYEGFRG